MTPQPTQILTDRKIEQKLTRMAYQMLEQNFEESELVLLGIKERGYILAQQLKTMLTSIRDIEVTVGALAIDKENPVDTAGIALETDQLAGKVIIIVDDVTNTGRTLMYALQPILQIAPKKVLTAVLVDRKHKAFPVSPDYVGLSLATTMQEHITVKVEQDRAVGAYLE